MVSPNHRLRIIAYVVEVVILVPPDAPITERTLPVFESTIIVGVILETGRFLGTMKLAGLGGTP